MPASEPTLLEKFVSGVVTHDGEMDYVGAAPDALAAVGLAPEDAIAVWAAVSALAIGQRQRGRIGHRMTLSLNGIASQYGLPALP
ncbi:hypothetical protein [Mycolicibacterium iranicum]|uniref:Uncharacterized protein n=1 Tax=Mycolicibacterium iranicum TaxID=912594 RepID=A0A178M1U9_MYCIR|nr:hypothetical protein [Mycolicibacterium iranicum]OAN40607.1 hypothetical protein A4X20_13490 [Mycolicibacterium iranicum]